MKKATNDKELTKAELQVMQILWAREKAFVHEILKDMAEPKPLIIQYQPYCGCW